MSIRPLFPYVGGKGRHVREILPFIKNFDTYYEPFVGGGAVLFALQPKRAVINDLNYDVINTYRMVRDNLEEIKEILMIHASNQSKDYFFKMLKAERLYKLRNVERAARFIYLSRSCFRGMLKRDKHGYLDSGFNYRRFYAHLGNVDRVSRYLRDNDITILNGDFEASTDSASSGDIVFFDPPYKNTLDEYNKTPFTDTERLRLCNLIKLLTNRGVKCLLTEAMNPYMSLHGDDRFYYHTMKNLDASLAIANGKVSHKMEEIIFTNYKAREQMTLF